MTEPRDSEQSLDPALLSRESAELVDLGRRLEQERPVPPAGFRGALRRQLLEAAGRQPSRPPHLGLRIAAYAGSGIALLVIAAFGVGGAGPLAAG
jgi:hypothetical protein